MFLARKTSTKLAIRKFYIVRHGQTDYNLRGVVQGSGINSSLNDTGRRQADLFFEAFQQVPFQKVYTSALQRTQQSVARFLTLGLPHEAVADFNEIHWGNKEGQPFTPEAESFYKTTLQAWAAGDLEARIEEGESAQELGDRLRRGMDYVLSQPGDLVLICMHGRAMRALLALLLGYSLSEMDRFEHNNLCLYELHYADGKFKLVRANDQAHLVSL